MGGAKRHRDVAGRSSRNLGYSNRPLALAQMGFCGASSEAGARRHRRHFHASADSNQPRKVPVSFRSRTCGLLDFFSCPGMSEERQLCESFISCPSI